MFQAFILSLPNASDFGLLAVLAGLVIADTLFGLAVAYKHRDLSSHDARSGFASKVFTLTGLVILHEIAGLPYLAVYTKLIDAIVVAFILFELLSVVENLTLLGILPKSFANRLRVGGEIEPDNNNNAQDNKLEEPKHEVKG